MSDFKEIQQTAPLYLPGKIMVINHIMIGMIMSSQWSYTQNSYRMVIDGNELAYRVKLKHFSQQDYFLFKEDINNLLYHTRVLQVIEADEDMLVELETYIEKYGMEGAD